MAKLKKVKECEAIKHCMVGKPTKYKKEVNIPLLIKCFMKGESVRQYCAKALITEPTFYNWLKDYPEFKYCYDIALNFAADFWERVPFENPDFNYPYLQAVLRSRFGLGKSKLKLTDKKQPMELIESIQEGLTDQKINIQDIKPLVELIQAKHKILANLDTENQEQKRYSIEECLEISEKLLGAAEILEKRQGNKANE